MCDKYGFTRQELKTILTEAKRESVDPFLEPDTSMYQPERLGRYHKLLGEIHQGARAWCVQVCRSRCYIPMSLEMYATIRLPTIGKEDVAMNFSTMPMFRGQTAIFETLS